MAYNLDHLSQPLSRDHRVLVPDLPGFGASDDPREEMGFREQIRVLHEAVNQMGFQGFTLVGVSYGGLLTMAWSSLHPEDLSGAVLLDMPPIRYAEPMPRDPRARPSPCPERFPTREAALEYCARVYPGFTREYMAGQLTYGGLGEDGSVVPPSPASRRRLLRWDRDFWADLAAARPPMLLVYGS